nr:PglZ domain-containing protein [Methylomarinum sp. Ch1-1]MDP4520845.1 PglZ domain-containing protein [Methylomarinum sp. Ch1-1]
MKSEILFAPLPTLTEVGKMAIVTGKPSSQLPSDQESAIRQSYQAYLPKENSLKVIKSWKSSASEHIVEETNLVVFFENRIDERLHDCVDFSKHRKDVAPILKQVMASIDNWKKDACYMNREVAFLITADHGMTVVQANYQGEVLGEVKERVFKRKNMPNDDIEGFEFIQQDTNYGYLVPTARVGLNDSAGLTHGGLTPEEVLVPFVTLTSRQPEAITTPLELTVLNNKCQRLGDKTWRLSVELFASVAVKNVEIKLESPLNGEESIMALDVSSYQRLFLDFSSSSEQIGLTDITIHLKYDRDGAHEINTKQFSCVFPESLIEKDATTQGFEDMFN